MERAKTLGVSILILYLGLLIILPSIFSFAGHTGWMVGTVILGFLSFTVAMSVDDANADATGSGLAYIFLCVVAGLPTYYLFRAFRNYPVTSILLCAGLMLFVIWATWKIRCLRQMAEVAAYEEKEREWSARQEYLREQQRLHYEEVQRQERSHREKLQRQERTRREIFNAKTLKITETDKSIKSLHYMSGMEFENFMADFLDSQGYKVKRLGGSGDQGVDLILKQEKKKIAVQLKRYSRPLGNKPVQEVFSGQFFHKANEAWVVTTSSFTKGGIDAARETHVRLIDGEELFEWIKDVRYEMRL